MFRPTSCRIAAPTIPGRRSRARVPRAARRFGPVVGRVGASGDARSPDGRRAAMTDARTQVAIVAKLVAKPETAEELQGFLAGAVGLANDEPGTVVWFALRTDATTFWIVDAFPGEAERTAHLQGRIAAALMESADRLLASPPELGMADVLAAKVP